ncbi:MAG TPA: glycosyltransferase family 2 protein, partial [Rhizomicrobium sp.]
MMSVILATHNGSDTIERSLAAMADMDAPDGGWELLLVDNASTDDTPNRVRAWSDRLPLVYLTEPRLGKSNAINLGLARAKGDLIVMTDDDVLPDRDWLVQWRRIADILPQCAAFGGAVVPEFESTRPPDYVPHWYYGALYGLTHAYEEGQIVPDPDNGLFHISGANIAIRKSVYEDGNCFDTSFLVGSQGMMGEDTEFVKRLGDKGYGVGFAPRARLRHLVHARQTSWGWIRHRFYRNGRAAFMLLNAHWDADAEKFRFRFPWERLRPALGSSLRLLVAKAKGDRNGAFKQSHGLTYDMAAIEQAISLSWKQAFRGKPR